MTKKEEFYDKFVTVVGASIGTPQDEILEPVEDVWQWIESSLKEERERVCKRQREICADFLEDEKGNKYEDYIKDIKSLIKSAPLATEEDK